MVFRCNSKQPVVGPRLDRYWWSPPESARGNRESDLQGLVL